MKSNVFKRLAEVWKPDFLSKLAKEEKAGPTFKFWFFWSTIASVIIVIFVMINIKGFEKEFLADVPDGEFVIQDGKLTTSGLTEPVFIEGDDGSIFVVDTQGAMYDETILDDYKSGAYVSADEVIIKENEYESSNYAFSTVGDFSISKQDVVDWMNKYSGIMYFGLGLIVFFAVWFGVSLGRLLIAFFWTLIFWLLAMIADVKPYKDFMKVYRAVVNFTVISVLVESVLLSSILGFRIPFGTTILFGVLFGIGYYKMKQVKDSDDVPEVPDKPSEEEAEEGKPKEKKSDEIEEEDKKEDKKEKVAGVEMASVASVSKKDEVDDRSKSEEKKDRADASEKEEEKKEDKAEDKKDDPDEKKEVDNDGDKKDNQEDKEEKGKAKKEDEVPEPPK